MQRTCWRCENEEIFDDAHSACRDGTAHARAPGKAREVGWALAALPDYHDLPAHRVVNRSGILTGERAFGPPGVMRALLEADLNPSAGQSAGIM